MRVERTFERKTILFQLFYPNYLARLFTGVVKSVAVIVALAKLKNFFFLHFNCLSLEPENLLVRQSFVTDTTKLFN